MTNSRKVAKTNQLPEKYKHEQNVKTPGDALGSAGDTSNKLRWGQIFRQSRLKCRICLCLEIMSRRVTGNLGSGKQISFWGGGDHFD